MRRRHTPLLLCLLLAPAARPQTAPATPPELHTLEDAVARDLDQARSAAHLRPLARIPDRTPLRQIVCTVAATAVPHLDLMQRESEADTAILLVDPTALQTGGPLPPDLARVAQYNDRNAARGRRITRFSVAAFRSSEHPDQAWVGLALYWSRSTEFLAIHLTRSYTPQVLRPMLTTACAQLR